MKKEALAIIKSMLGLTEFAKKDGVAYLSEDEQKAIKANFGEEILTQVTAAIATADDTDQSDENNHDGQVAAFATLIKAMSDQSAKNQASMQAKIDTFIKENGGLKAAIEKLANKPEDEPLPEMDATIPRAANMPTVMRVNPKSKVYAAAMEFLKTGRNISAANEAGDTIDVADLKTEFGTFLNTQRNLDIMRQVLTGFTSAKYMTTKMAITEYRAIQSDITSVSQQFSPKWTPSGKTKFTPIIIKNRRHKINYPITPADVLDSYMMYLYDEGMAPDQMPITKYITNQLVLPKLLDDIELRMSAKGRYEDLDWSGVDEGDAGQTPEKSMDGYETILVDQKASGTSKMKFFNRNINWKTATDQEVLDWFAAYVDWIDPRYQGSNLNIHTSMDVYKRYKRAYKNIWGAGSGTEKTEFGSDTIDFSVKTIVPLMGMYRSPIVFCTPKENFIKLRYKNEVPNIINDVQKYNYTVKLFGEYWLGIGFAIAEAVFAYVPDDYDPQALIAATWGESTDYSDYIPESDGSGSAGGGL